MLTLSRFPTAAHLASWARFAPGVNSSAGKPKGNGATGHGNRYLAGVLGVAAISAARTKTHHVVKVEVSEQLVQVRGEGVVVVAERRLAGIAEPPPVVSDHAVSRIQQDRYLLLPGTTAQRKAVDQHDRLAGPSERLTQRASFYGLGRGARAHGVTAIAERAAVRLSGHH